MNKQEFLNQLEKRLDRINEAERKDILMEYGTYIDDKMATGVSEEDAVSGFGDVDELAEEILDAYKINTDNVQTKVDKTLDKVYVRSESLLNRLGNLSVNDFFHIVFDAFVLLIILFIGKVLIVDLLGNLFISLLFSFSGGYLSFIENLLEFLWAIVYFLAGVFFFFSVMSRRINRYKNKASIRQVGVMEDIKNTWNQESRTLVNGNDDNEEKLPPLPKDRAPLYHQRMKTPPINNEGTHILAKILIVMVAIPVVIALISFSVIFFAMIFVSITQQATSIGLYLIFLGLICGSISVLWFLVHVWPKKEVKTDA